MLSTPTRYSCLALLAALLIAPALQAAPPEGEGWVSLFNGKDLTGWKYKDELPQEVRDIWRVVDGTIDCQPKLRPGGDKSLYTEKEFGDYQLSVEWRITDTKGTYEAPVVLPDGSVAQEDGKDKTVTIENADSGIYNRGFPKAQVNIWCWPIGSGEVYGYRTDKSQPAEVRAGVTPSENADKPVGEWNHFLITMKGDRLTVELNGVAVIEDAQLPGIPKKGPLALQHHGGYDAEKDEWNGASSLVQFRNIYIRELNTQQGN